MKFLIIACALLAVAYADVSELASGYDYPAPVHHHEHHEPERAYVPPAPVHHEVASEPIAPVNTYIPPAAEVHHEVASEPIAAPQNTYIPPAAHVHHEEASLPLEEIEQPAADGYHYRTVRRRVFRYRH